MRCQHYDNSAFIAVLDALPTTGDLTEDLAARERAFRDNPPVECDRPATRLVRVPGEHEDEDSEIRLCGEHVSEWVGDDSVDIYAI